MAEVTGVPGRPLDPEDRDEALRQDFVEAETLELLVADVGLRLLECGERLVDVQPDLLPLLDPISERLAVEPGG